MASGVYKVTIGRTTTMHGHEVGNAMGVHTWAAFLWAAMRRPWSTAILPCAKPSSNPCSKHYAVLGINVVAIHQHMAMESPRVLFLHYWGQGLTRALATGLKAALATQQP